LQACEHMTFTEPLKKRVARWKEPQRSSRPRAETVGSTSNSADKAIVVIHGIGAQQPLSVLRSVARNLKKVDVKETTVQETRTQFGTPFPPDMVRMEYGEVTADVYEVYWAPKAHHKTNARSVLGWVLALTFRKTERLDRKPWSVRLKNFYDIGILTVGLILLAAFLIVTFVSLSSIVDQANCTKQQGTGECSALEGISLTDEKVYDTERTGQVLEVIRRSVSTRANYLTLELDDLSFSRLTGLLNNVVVWQILVLAAIGWIALQVFFRTSVEAARTIGFVQKTIALLYLPLLILFAQGAAGAVDRLLGNKLGPYLSAALLVFVFGWLYPRVFRSILKEPAGTSSGDQQDPGIGGRPENSVWSLLLLLLLIPLVPTLLVAFTLVFVMAYVLVRTLSTFLTESVGDIQVYTTNDPNSEYFEVRQTILDEVQLVFGAIAPKEYDSIVVIGHSLGSVIAIDALPVLQQREPDVFNSIDTIITLGSPLEKVRKYFTPSKSALRVPADQQLVSVVDEKWEKLTDLARAAELVAGRGWLNLWYANDPVANPLTAFGPSQQKHLGAWRHGPLKGEIPTTAQMLDWSRANKGISNGGYGWRWKLRLLWPHGDYWIDEDVLLRIRDAAFVPIIARQSTDSKPSAT
jgi:hypothetical protein